MINVSLHILCVLLVTVGGLITLLWEQHRFFIVLELLAILTSKMQNFQTREKWGHRI
jgi:hypothetical protein